MAKARSDGPWGHVHRLEFVLRKTRLVDEVAGAALDHLVALPDVTRVGLALVEGGGRRLRFTASGRGVENVDTAEPPAGSDAVPVELAGLAWCHIDAYDDVPLTTVVRSGRPVLGNLDALEDRYAGVVARQRAEGTRAMAVVPLDGPSGSVGGLVVYYDAEQAFDATQRRLLAVAARRIAEALRRVRPGIVGRRGGARPVDPALRAEDRSAHVHLEDNPRSSGAARRFLRETLAGWGVKQEVSEVAELLTSELVNNVIMHAGTDAELSAHLEDRTLGVVVRDGGGGPAAPEIPVEGADLPISGRGLVLVDALAERWGTDRDADGTTSWFVLSLGAEGDSQRTS